MLSVNTDKKVYAATLASARFVVSVDWFYESVVNRLTEVEIIIKTRIASYFFIRVLKTRRKKIEYAMNYLNKNNLTTTDYKTLKGYLNSFDELLPTMNKVQSYDLKDVPTGMRHLVSEMKRTTTAVFKYKECIKKRLNRLNVEQFPTSQTQFKFISEKELSDKRVDVYEYWL